MFVLPKACYKVQYLHHMVPSPHQKRFEKIVIATLLPQPCACLEVNRAKEHIFHLSKFTPYSHPRNQIIVALKCTNILPNLHQHFRQTHLDIIFKHIPVCLKRFISLVYIMSEEAILRTDIQTENLAWNLAQLWGRPQLPISSQSRKPYQLLKKNVGPVSGKGMWMIHQKSLRKAREMLTEYLSQVDNAGNLKFTFKEGENGSIAFLDTKLTRKEDGRGKVEVYRKNTHTNQYLSGSICFLSTTQYITNQQWYVPYQTGV